MDRCRVRLILMKTVRMDIAVDDADDDDDTSMLLSSFNVHPPSGSFSLLLDRIRSLARSRTRLVSTATMLLLRRLDPFPLLHRRLDGDHAAQNTFTRTLKTVEQLQTTRESVGQMGIYSL